MVDDRKTIERAKQEALLHYINGGVYDLRYDRDLIRYLINVGYLGWDMTDDLKDYHWTTAMGLIYLRSRGYDVPAPKVRNGRIVGVDEYDRLVDWDPSELKGSETTDAGGRPRSKAEELFETYRSQTVSGASMHHPDSYHTDSVGRHKRYHIDYFDYSDSTDDETNKPLWE